MSMAKTINVARRNKKKRTTRKNRGGGCSSSTCRQSNEVLQNEVLQNEVLASQNGVLAQLAEQIAYTDALNKILRFYNSQIIHKLKKEYRDKVDAMRDMLIPIIKNVIKNDLKNLTSFGHNLGHNLGHNQQLIEAYNGFRRDPALSLLFDLPDDIINLEFDNRFQNRDELITYLGEPAIIDLLDLNYVKFKEGSRKSRKLKTKTK